MKFKIKRYLKYSYSRNQPHTTKYSLTVVDPDATAGYRWLGDEFESEKEALDFARSYKDVFKENEVEL